MTAQEPVTLDNCASEPIHIPGAIQPHGVLLACRGPELRVTQVSANAQEFLAVEVDAVLGHPVGALFDAASRERLEQARDEEALHQVSPIRLASLGGALFDASLHRSAESLVVELEPASPSALTSARAFDPRLRASLLRLQKAEDVEHLCTFAAEEVRRLTQFDRVMVYRFDADWHGHVVAESKRDELEPFLGLHYPASDIPAQARRLYTVNWLRFIGDVSYRPVPLVPALDPEGEPLDLSHSVLRSVSPIHLEYLRNMGVTASMSISLVVEGKLSGLIACHHYRGPFVVPVAVRDTAEYLGQALSWQLHVLEAADLAQRRRLTQEREADLVRSVAIATELDEALDTPSLLAVSEAEGAAVVLVEGTRVLGNAPPAAVISTIVEWLATNAHDVYATDHLGDSLPALRDWEHVAAGLLAVAIAREVREYLLWFRPAVERTVRWAGDPRKTVTWSDADKAPRLSPRGSFELWLETVRGHATPWGSWQIEAASSLRRVILSGVRKKAVELKHVNERLIAADRAKDEFIATVSHELRTPLNAISGWANMLQSGQISGERTGQALEVITRNAKLQTRLIEDLLDMARITSGKLTLEVEPVDFAALIETVIEGSLLSADAKGIRIKRTIDSGASPVLGDPARLRQIVSNLLSNAIKFTPKGGTVSLCLQRLDSDVELSLWDTGRGIDPAFLLHLFEPFRQQDQKMNRRSQGLGLGLAIVKRLTELHGGTVTAESAGVGKGSCFRVRLPMAPLVARESVAPEGPEVLREDAPSLAGLRILVVEDEPDARGFVAHFLREARAQVDEAADARSALELLEQQRFDAIVSDVGMPELDGLAFMRLLRTRPPERGGKTPAIALTAYTRGVDRTSALRAGFQAHVPKPVDINELVAVVASLCGRI